MTVVGLVIAPGPGKPATLLTAADVVALMQKMAADVRSGMPAEPARKIAGLVKQSRSLNWQVSPGSQKVQLGAAQFRSEVHDTNAFVEQ